MFYFALGNLGRRPWRSVLTLAGLAMAIAALACLLAFGEGYGGALRSELDRMGIQMMLVPLGCPYDAAARVLKGKNLEFSLPHSALEQVQRDSAVAEAAPLLIAAVPREKEARTDMWVGLDETGRGLKPWWKSKSGADWFTGPSSVILGAEAAQIEMRVGGDKLFSPETGWTFSVAGLLERSGTSDDSLFFVPLATAQAMFGQTNRLTAIAIRLRDPVLMTEAVQRLQRIPGAQVVTLTEMLGTFLNLVGSVRTLLEAVAILAIAVGALSAFNTLLAAVVERSPELSMLRAIGASRFQVFCLIAIESFLLGGLGSLCGLMLAPGLGRGLEVLARQVVPLAPPGNLFALTWPAAACCLAAGMAAGFVSGLYPAWRASRVQPAERFGWA